MSAEGFGVIPNWLVRDTSVTGAAKMVYVVLSSHAGSGGTTWLSHATIAAEAGVSVSTVQRAIRDLLALDLVAQSQRRRDDGGQTSNLYRLHTHTPIGQSDRPPRSQVPTPSVSVTDEEEPLKKNPRRKNSSPSGDGGLYVGDAADFAEFWLVYPKKADKKTAMKAWRTEVVKEKIPLDQVMQALRVYLTAQKDPRYLKYPATWLRATDFAEATSTVAADRQAYIDSIVKNRSV